MSVCAHVSVRVSVCTRIYPNVPGIMLAGLHDDLIYLTLILQGNRPRSPSETDQHDSRDIWIDPRMCVIVYVIVCVREDGCVCVCVWVNVRTRVCVCVCVCV